MNFVSTPRVIPCTESCQASSSMTHQTVAAFPQNCARQICFIVVTSLRPAHFRPDSRLHSTCPTSSYSGCASSVSCTTVRLQSWHTMRLSDRVSHSCPFAFSLLHEQQRGVLLCSCLRQYFCFQKDATQNSMCPFTCTEITTSWVSHQRRQLS